MLSPARCANNRDQVLTVFRSQAKESFRLAQIEVIDGGDVVVLCMRSADAADPDQTAQIFQVFTFADDRIVRMQDFEHRDDALLAAGLADRAGWD